jgi:hypothetical protein
MEAMTKLLPPPQTARIRLYVRLRFRVGTRWTECVRTLAEYVIGIVLQTTRHRECVLHAEPRDNREPSLFWKHTFPLDPAQSDCPHLVVISERKLNFSAIQLINSITLQGIDILFCLGNIHFTPHESIAH